MVTQWLLNSLFWLSGWALVQRELILCTLMGGANKRFFVTCYQAAVHWVTIFQMIKSDSVVTVFNL